jgi:hypothetical protein
MWKIYIFEPDNSSKPSFHASISLDLPRSLDLPHSAYLSFSLGGLKVDLDQDIVGLALDFIQRGESSEPERRVDVRECVAQNLLDALLPHDDAAV